MGAIRPAAVAGSFYPAEPQTLSRDILGYLGSAGSSAVSPLALKAVLVPHAGYRYSGPVAAAAYRLVGQGTPVYRRVVVLGPAHRLAFPGLALPAAKAFSTPLGTVRLDTDSAASLGRCHQVTVSAEAHAWEHSLEVQLPFLQTVLGGFSLVPLVVGDAGPRAVADVCERLWGGEETLFVISSDLSHYLPYDEAVRVDASTARSIERLETVDSDHACGAYPLNGFLLAARHHGLICQRLDLRNSGDTAGDKSRVVGYGSWAFREAGDDA